MSKVFVAFAICTMLMAAPKATVIDPSDENILYTGRWDFTDPSVPWCQAKASSIIVNFEGTSIGIDITGNSSDYVRAIFDDDAAGSIKIPLVGGVNILASGLTDTTHKLEFVKENDKGRMYVYGIHLDDGKSLVDPPERPTRKIEFYGDSNQAGYSLESERNQGGSHLQGAYYTYPGIVARMFDAEHVNFSKSGATIQSLDTAHDRTDWNSSAPPWDFSNFQADLVVVNIGANDSGADHVRKNRYHALLDDLRAEQPTAHIMLYNAYGWSFNEPANFIHEVIAERGDPNMSSAVFPWVFAQFHGCEYDHGGMAMVLAEHVQSIMGWTHGQQDVLSGFGADGDVANGSFELVAPFGGWGWRYLDARGISREFDPAGAHDGDYYLRLFDTAHSQQTNPADSGETYVVTAWMRGANVGDQVDITIDFRDQGMGAGEVSPMVAFTETKTLTTTWQEYSMSATAPTTGNPVYGTRVTFTVAAGDTVDIDAVAMCSGDSCTSQTSIEPDSLTVLRGFHISGDLSDAQESDDSYLKFNPGITLSPTEPPVWIEFSGTLKSDSPATLSVTLEASVDTVGLTQTIEMFNWNTDQYEEVDAQSASLNFDSVATIDLTANIAAYVERGTGAVKTRAGWRATGIIFVYPWTTCIDQVVWTVTD